MKSIAMEESSSLFDAIARISKFSYEPCISKYPFLKEYLKNKKDSKNEWVLYMTAAGAGYALSTKEKYPNEHDELIKSIEAIDGLTKIVESFCVFIQDIYKNNNELYSFGIGFWILTQIKNGKPTLKELEKFPNDIVEILNQTIQNYEKQQLMK